MVLESDEAEPTPGSWVGVVLGDRVSSETVVSNVTIRFAGEPLLSITQGCITIDGAAAGRVAVDESRFESCQQSAVAVRQDDFLFVSSAGNTFVDAETGYWIPASAAGSVAGGQTFTGTPHNRLRGGTVVASATWRAQPVPWNVDDHVEVRGTDAPRLTLEAGLNLRFAAGTWLRVGDVDPGGLVAQGAMGNPVILESQLAVPVAGSWVGVVLRDRTLAGTLLDRVTIRHAGEPLLSVTRGAVTLTQTAATVTISNATFELNAQADVYVDCDSTPDLSGNAYSVAGLVNEVGC